MADLISRPALLTALANARTLLMEGEDMVGRMYGSQLFREVEQIVKDTEAVDAEPIVYAQWADVSEDFCDEPVFRCTNCGEEWTFIEGTPLENHAHRCPRCGARMRAVTAPYHEDEGRESGLFEED